MAIPDPPRVITRAQLSNLLGITESPVLSLYHPAERVVVEPEENSLHLKSLLAQAQEKLEGKGLRRKELDMFLTPLEELVEAKDFWFHQLGGIGIFRTHDSLRYFKLPYRPPETVVLTDSPYVKPLLPALWPDARFFIVAFSHNTIRLLHCTSTSVDEIDLSSRDFPHNLAEELRYDDLQKPELQHHPTTGPGRTPEGHAAGGPSERGERRHAFHGHGTSGEGEKTQIRRFFHDVDRGLMKLLHGETVPMVTAGVDYLHSLFRETSSYPNILDEHIEGAIDRLRPEQLHEKAMPVIERRKKAEVDDLSARYGNAISSGLSSAELAEILPAAHEGRIDVLFLRATEPDWGIYDHALEQVSVRPEIDGFEGEVIDLHDLAARRVIESSGSVYVLGPEEMPEGTRIAALFRFNPAVQGRGTD